MYKITLPFPPSVNGYWRAIKRGKICANILSQKGREYKEQVKSIIGDIKPLEGRLAVYIELCPPDRRKRDIDNYSKALLDSLTESGVWLDDEQIDYLLIARGDRDNCARVAIDFC